MKQLALLVERFSLGDSKRETEEVEAMANAAISVVGSIYSSESSEGYSSWATNTILGAFLKKGFFLKAGFF